MSTKVATPLIAPPQPGTTTTTEPALPEGERRECHTIDNQDESRAVCGFRFGGGDGDGDGGGYGRHSKSECKRAGHHHCASCEALCELGLNGGRY